MVLCECVKIYSINDKYCCAYLLVCTVGIYRVGIPADQNIHSEIIVFCPVVCHGAFKDWPIQYQT